MTSSEETSSMNVEQQQKEELEDSDDVIMDLDVESIPAEVQEYAEKVLGETDDVRIRSLQELEDLIYERGEANPHRMDEAFLLRFLRARSFRVESAHRLLIKYCQFRERNSHYYKGVDPLQSTYIGESDVLSVLPYREQNGRRIMVFKPGKWDVNAYDMDEIFKAAYATLELGILEPRAQILGGIVIFDLLGFSMQQAWQVTPNVAVKILDLMGISFPIRTMAIHILNESRVFDIAYAVFKQFISAKYLSLIHFHGDNMESLHTFIDPKYLPECYGGIRKDYPPTRWFNNLRKSEFIVKEMKSLGYEEKKAELAGE